MRRSTLLLLSLLLVNSCSHSGPADQAAPEAESGAAAGSADQPAPATPSDTGDCRLLFWEDGDTAVVDCPSGGRVTVRLVGIDTPESGFDDNSRRRGQRQVRWWHLTLEQVFACGKAATRRVRQLCPRSSPVRLEGDKLDKYGRRLAKIFCRGMDINEQLVKEGLAGRYPYPRRPEKPAACPVPE